MTAEDKPATKTRTYRCRASRRALLEAMKNMRLTPTVERTYNRGVIPGGCRTAARKAPNK